MSDPSSLALVPLADRPDLIPTLATWIHTEWQAFDSRSINEVVEQLRGNLRRDGVPITFVALEDDTAVGTVSLDASDLPSHDHLSPWLASLYVVPKARGRGVGSALIERVLTFARSHANVPIHLWTPDSTARYERWGWREIERTAFAGHPICLMQRDP